MDHSLSAEDVRQAGRLLVVEPQDFSPADQQVLATAKPGQRFESAEQALTNASPAVIVQAEGAVRVLPRVKPGSAVIHLVNWSYDAARDGVQPMKNVRLKLNLPALGVAGATEARWFAPGTQPAALPIRQESVTVPELGLRAVVELRSQ